MSTEYRDGQHYPATYEDYVPPGVIARCMLEIYDYIYPVGCYFETTDTTFDPNEYFKGTWELETEGLVHISSGTNYAVSNNAQDGGEKTHVLTIQEMPSHGHGWRGVNSKTTMTAQTASYPFGITADYKYNWDGTDSMIKNTGGGQAHNNMPPYKIVNRWHRTA